MGYFEPETDGVKWDGANLKEILKRKGIRLGEFAEKLNVSRQSLNAWINGDIPRGDFFIKICNALEICPNDLFSMPSKEKTVMSIGFFN